MRTLTFDQWEFEPPDGEEALEVSVAAKNDFLFPNLAAFARAVCGDKFDDHLAVPTPFTEEIGPGNVRSYLRRYAGFDLPDGCDWPTYVVPDDWDDFDAILVGPATFIRYHWSTTA